ncbi:TetR/AcrR family transcriptional regulator [Candidatus Rhodoluna planktonica]|uniref:HTH tetR-type domain-containing protein n=1 Tax=Candidatus Rhodoluna planktonica TaxID=535712 RepID=A0A1D9DXP1_9MICO|nr:TetR/AcrR family transcriptional regulator [Candidatus Rhodoluna planktonica]AOY55574.1 hypothetical protein A4Z71_00725 [Candidatus Rhodoluna planktonica]
MSFRTKHFPQPKQDRAKDTVDLVIKEADKAIKAGGEAAVRIQEISKAAKVSIGSIYHHFGDRDGLIRATYVHNFSTAVREDINRVKAFHEQDAHDPRNCIALRRNAQFFDRTLQSFAS